MGPPLPGVCGLLESQNVKGDFDGYANLFGKFKSNTKELNSVGEPCKQSPATFSSAWVLTAEGEQVNTHI